MNPNHGVYVVANKVNDKVYVGKTIGGFRKRWNEHRCDAKSKGTHFMRAIRKHGADSFYRVGWIQVGDEFLQQHNLVIGDVLNELERGLIALLESWKPDKGYNITLGGEGTSGRTLSPETRAEISARQTGRILSPETRAKMSASRMGRVVSPETREKIGESNAKRYADPAARTAISERVKKQMANPEARALISRVMTGRVFTAEHRSKISECKKVQMGTPEARARTSKIGSLTSHNRWHVARNIINPKCRLCTMENS
jgi:group I intron endonuclease